MIDQTVVIPRSSAKQLYDLLLDSTDLTILTSDVADVDPKVGGSFSIFGGYATGKTLRLIPEKLIEQSWRASNWPQDHYSKIRFELSDTDGGAQIHFVQANLPVGTDAEFEAGWYDFYWNPLTEYFSE